MFTPISLEGLIGGPRGPKDNPGPLQTAQQAASGVQLLHLSALGLFSAFELAVREEQKQGLGKRGGQQGQGSFLLDRKSL